MNDSLGYIYDFVSTYFSTCVNSEMTWIGVEDDSVPRSILIPALSGSKYTTSQGMGVNMIPSVFPGTPTFDLSPNITVKSVNAVRSVTTVLPKC